MAQQGRTAEGAALMRAWHYLYARPPVFYDPWAIHLVRSPLARLCRTPVLGRRLLQPQPFLRRISTFALCSFRYSEEQLDQALERGVRQYVILGAGLDSFALRRPELEGQLRVFEVDHPATQALKRARVERAAGATPEHVEYVPVDFEVETLAQGLGRSSFDAAALVFVSWLSTIPYLTPGAVESTLRAVAELAAPGSEVVASYGAPPTPEERSELARLRRGTRNLGEPIQSTFETDAFEKLARASGYEVRAHLSGAELDGLYLAHRGDGLCCSPAGRIAHLGWTRP